MIPETVPRRWFLHSARHLERWDWRNSVEQGIGGSETSHVEMAWRLARRGYEVTTYAPIPEDCSGEWRGTTWRPVSATDYSQPGIWIIYRSPAEADHFDHTRKDQYLMLLMQDWDYPEWTPERLEHFDQIICMCDWHARYTARLYPSIKDKIILTANGVKGELIHQNEADQAPTRNPKRLIWTSSPDRGLEYLIQAFTRAREYVSDLELHAFYGFDNIDKLLALNPAHPYWSKSKARIMRLLTITPGVTWHGRTTQPELYRWWLSSGLWVYQTNFLETSCISCMEAQAMGAIPIFNPVGALAENVTWGVPIAGDAYGDPLIQARYAAEIVRMATSPDLQETIRQPMMAESRQRCDWERRVDQWASWLKPEAVHAER